MLFLLFTIWVILGKSPNIHDILFPYLLKMRIPSPTKMSICEEERKWEKIVQFIVGTKQLFSKFD
jgi:hypothetical protein